MYTTSTSQEENVTVKHHLENQKIQTTNNMNIKFKIDK